MVFFDKFRNKKKDSKPQIDRAELIKKVEAGAHKAIKDYGKTFEILKEYDKK